MVENVTLLKTNFNKDRQAFVDCASMIFGFISFRKPSLVFSSYLNQVHAGIISRGEKVK